MRSCHGRWATIFIMMLSIAMVGCALGNGTDQGGFFGPLLSAGGRTTLQSLRYERQVATMSPEQLVEEYGRVEQAYSADPSESLCFKLVILLCLENTAHQDEQRAEKMLQECLADPREHHSETDDLAHHLLATIRQRQELARKYHAAEKALQHSQQQCRELEEKLEALKRIEESIMERQNIPEAPPQ